MANDRIGCGDSGTCGCCKSCKIIRKVFLKEEIFTSNTTVDPENAYKLVFNDQNGNGFTINQMVIQAFGSKPYCTDDVNMRFSNKFTLIVPNGGSVIVEKYLIDDKEVQ